MRIEPYSTGSIVHVMKRGARGMEIVRDTADHWRFVQTLYILNDVHQDVEWTRYRHNQKLFERPQHWPARKPLTSILGWTLMRNHFHLLLCEIQEGGISKFMQRLGGSMTLYFNKKYNEKGSIFQGAYKSRTVDSDSYLRYLLAYIIVKNVFELYPGGLIKATKEFDKAWAWAAEYQFSSFQATAFVKNSPVLDVSMLRSLGLPGRQFKRVARDMLLAHVERKSDEVLEPSLLLEDW